MLAQGKASPGKKLEAFLKNFYFTFTFHKICKIKLNMDILLHFLFYLICLIFSANQGANDDEETAPLVGGRRQDEGQECECQDKFAKL